MSAPVKYTPPGDRGARFDHWVVLVAFWVTLALVCVAAVVVALVRETDTTVTKCTVQERCPGPPPVLPAAGLRRWTSHAHGVSLEYPVRVFALEEQSQDTLRLRVKAARPSGVEVSALVQLQSASEGGPQVALDDQQEALSTSILGLTADQNPQTIIPQPRIGNILGVGGSYRGTVDTPQGPSDPAIVLLAAAGNGRTTAVVSYVITGTNDSNEISLLRRYLSPILTSFTWKA
jgi:hypothetical protein